jgi:hypothetical protein
MRTAFVSHIVPPTFSGFGVRGRRLTGPKVAGGERIYMALSAGGPFPIQHGPPAQSRNYATGGLGHPESTLSIHILSPKILSPWLSIPSARPT